MIVSHSSNPGAFLSLEGFVLVLFGSFSYAMMSYPFRTVKQAVAAIFGIATTAPAGPEELKSDIRTLVEWAQIVQSKGLKTFEKTVSNQLHEPLLKYGSDLLVSNYAPADVRRLMEISADSAYERNTQAVGALKNMAASAPAFGMVGTLLGMVVMLGNFESDMSKIGAGMAIAMLATFYGLVTSRLIFLPAADNLLMKQDRIRFRGYLLAEGFALITEKRNPSFVQDALDSYIDPAHHQDIPHTSNNTQS